MKRFKKQVAFVIAVVIALTIIIPATAAAANVGGVEVSSQGACIIDFETGIVLFGHEAFASRVPASMTKVLAVYVIYDAIRAGELSLDTETQISSGVSELSYNWEYSNVPLQEGSTVTIRELIDVVMIHSACAATVALGEALCGSEQALVDRMNAKCRNLGINAQFYDSYGVSANNRISPFGMAKLSRYLILNHPEVLAVASKGSVTFRGTEYRNTNRLLGEYAGIDGLKTGYTDAAGYCFVGTATQWGRRIVAVTMGSTMDARFPDSRTLLNYGFEHAGRIIQEYLSSSSALPSNANLILDGREVPLTAFLIGGSHYFKLRDIALLLSETDSLFDVTWYEMTRSVSIALKSPYVAVGGELGELGEDERQYIPSPSRFFIDFIEYSMEIYLVEGNNYFKLRDLAGLIGFEVDWIEETRTVIIETGTEYPDIENPEIEDPDDEGPDLEDDDVAEENEEPHHEEDPSHAHLNAMVP